MQYRTPIAVFGERLLEWHAGQSSALYSIGSRLLAGQILRGADDRRLVRAAEAELQETLDGALMAVSLRRLRGWLFCDPVLLGYLAAVGFLATDDAGYGPLSLSLDEFSDSALDGFRRDVREFVRLASAIGWGGESPQHLGHDFWLTRNNHGAGFWDGDWELGNELTELALRFGNVDVYLHDGILYQCAA